MIRVGFYEIFTRSAPGQNLKCKSLIRRVIEVVPQRRFVVSTCCKLLMVKLVSYDSFALTAVFWSSVDLGAK